VRRVGLPQVHSASDVLGDTYIDPVRRRMLRKHADFCAEPRGLTGPSKFRFNV
jgi:hypothetical protein